MRLNIGCGKQYLPGYTNVDLYERDIADLIAPADGLYFVKDNSVQEIISFHLIEHLGLIDTYKTLSHWAKKLEPGGKLIIETPDLLMSLKTLVRTKAPGDSDWLFGVCDDGQTHKHPFFLKELIEILKLLGFKNIKNKKPLGYWKKNTIRIECEMGSSDHSPRIIEKWSNIAMSQAMFCSLPFNTIKIFPKIQAIAKMAVYSPRLAIAALEVLEENSNKAKISDQKIKLWKGMIDKIESEKITFKLFQHLINLNIQNNDFRSSFKGISAMAEKEITKSLKKGKTKLKLELSQPNNTKTIKFLNEHQELTNFFTLHNLNELSLLSLSLGIKSFSKKNYESAMHYLQTSIEINPKNTISWWNLARVYWILNNKASADNAFNKAFDLSKDEEIMKEKIRTVPIKRPVEISYAAEI